MSTPRSLRVNRILKWIKRIGFVVLPLSAIVVVLWFWPTTETLHGPRKAVLHSEIPGLELGVIVKWYDLGLNPEGREELLDFTAEGIALLPSYTLTTSLARLWLKRLLMPHGRWTECENCYGPTAVASLYRKRDFSPPGKTKYVQNSKTTGDVIEFTVSLIPDEEQYEERPLLIDDLAALMSEAKVIIANGRSEFIKPETYGPALRRLNPVRVESNSNSVIVWMGGTVRYTINPDTNGGPMVNGFLMSGTDYPGIQKIGGF